MSVEGFEEVPFHGFGGLVTNIDRHQLPIGLSPNCSDVEFAGFAVQSRRGSVEDYDTTIASGVQYLSAFTKLNGARELIHLLADGTLGGKAAGTITTNMGVSVRARGANLFGRHYLCRGDGKLGSAPPVKYCPDTAYDQVQRVAIDGPAAAPTVGAGAAGTIPAGTYYVRVAFIYESGYTTPLGPANSGYVAAGANKLAITNIPLGPAAEGVIARRLYVSTEPDSGYYSIDTAGAPMLIPDNTSTAPAADLEFDDETLRSGLSGDALLRQIVLPPQMGCVAYNRRLFFWGGKNALSTLNQRGFDRVPYLGPGLQAFNLNFDGGFAAGGQPVGWSIHASSTGGEGSAKPAGATGRCYKITGNGVGAIRGYIYCSTSPEYLFDTQKSYGIRLRVAKGDSHKTGTLKIQLTGGGGFTTVVASWQASALSANFATYEASFVAATSSIPSYPTSFQLEILADNSGGSILGNGKTFLLDEIEFFETTDPNTGNIVYGSRRDFPDAIDGRDGFLVAQGQDQGGGDDVRCCFVLRNALYMAKEHSLFVASDNGFSEPVGWNTEQVSSSIGTPSPHGVAVGDGFAVILSRSGAYLFDGGVPVKISQEIQPLWDSFVWSYGHYFWTAIDTEKKQIYFGVIYNNVTAPDRVYVCNYQNGFGDPEPGGGGRRWTWWTLPTNGMVVAEDPSSFLLQTYYGLETTGKVNRLTTTAYGDATLGTVTAIYETGPVPASNPVRAMVGQLQMRILGTTGPTAANQLKVYFVDNAGHTVTQITPASGASLTLTSIYRDHEYPLRLISTNLGFRFSLACPAATSYYFQLYRLGVWVKRMAPFGPVRGII